MSSCMYAYMKWALATLYTWTLDVTLCSMVSSPKQPVLMTDPAHGSKMRSLAVSTLQTLAHTAQCLSPMTS